MPKVKICCIASIEEARLAISLGASAIGLVSAMPSGPGVIDEIQIAAIAAAIPSSIDSFLLTSLTNAESIVAQHQRCRTLTIQLVDRVSKTELLKLRAALPNVKLVQVVHVTSFEAVAESIQVSPLVDSLLLDSGDPNLAIKELGGTGRIHNWSISKQIVLESKIPVFLAGGINAANVSDAVNLVNPFGLDLCSSVRTHGRLDEVKLREFMIAAAACEIL
jgi:phosphoribosylanthranilate isomerase